MVPDEQIPTLEQVTDLLLDPLLTTGGALRGLRGETAPPQLGGVGRQALAQLGHGGADRLGYIAKDVERTKLMGPIAEDRGDRLGVQRRAVGGDPLEDQAARLQVGLGAVEERLDVFVGRVVAEDLVGEPLEGTIVDDRQDAERAVRQLVGGDEAREVGECPVEVIGRDPPRRLFPPRPRPSSGSWRRGRTRGARARGSNWRCDTVSRPR